MFSKTIQDVTAIENVLVREDKNTLSSSRGKPMHYQMQRFSTTKYIKITSRGHHFLR